MGVWKKKNLQDLKNAYFVLSTRKTQFLAILIRALLVFCSKKTRRANEEGRIRSLPRTKPFSAARSRLWMGTPSKLSVIRTSPRRQDGEPRGEAPVHGASSELFAAFASRDPPCLLAS